eukprot:TRINITY_DN3256_c0_g1_i1.p1 TRINITY_DN3256_c0_g1~~TRINITY_DN3256_c0_g1_i1.p1  ORF type:complete len:128 (-),score=10.37 TRINITY_DN3256_c0_g1_i1:98-481(-)
MLLTTSRPSNAEEFCSEQTFESDSAYYCTSDGTGYYFCLSGEFAPQSATFACPTGTECKCDVGEECSADGSQSPCTDANSKTGAIVGGVVGAAGGLLLGALGVAFLVRRNKHPVKEADLADVDMEEK